MQSRGQLLKYIVAQNPQALPERLAFYNFLSFLSPTEAPITTDDINFFFESALEYPHWRQNKNQLGQEVLKLLQSAQNILGQEFDLSKVNWPFDTQIIEIESIHELSLALDHFFKHKRADFEKFRLINDQGKNLLGVVLKKSGVIEVHQFDRKMIISGGTLVPLRQQLCLAYDANLSLFEKHSQNLEISPYTLCQFQILHQEVYGRATHGYLFQKAYEFRGGLLPAHTKLFFAIKRLEQYFIDKRTDEYYQDLISSLENSIALADLGPTEQTLNALHRAEFALEQVFTGDKLLSLLVRTLQTELKSKNGSKELNH